MRSRLLNPAPERTYAVVLDPGDEPIDCLTRLARDERLDAARFTGIRAFSDAVLGFFDLDSKDYERIPVGEQVEVVSLVGDVALGPDGAPKLHAHAVLARRDGSACGGHLLEAHVRPTLEVMLVESPSRLQRRIDPATGLALIDLDRS
jgi:predicted DNA-binding protein with PD1-like motif